jgi:hypothetical protein
VRFIGEAVATITWGILIGVGVLIAPLAVLLFIYFPAVGAVLGLISLALILVGTIRVLGA